MRPEGSIIQTVAVSVLVLCALLFVADMASSQSDDPGIEEGYGVQFQQVSFDFLNDEWHYSSWGRMEVNANQLAEMTGVTHGYINVIGEAGWLVANFPVKATDIIPIVTYFNLGHIDFSSPNLNEDTIRELSRPFELFNAYVTYTPEALEEPMEGEMTSFILGQTVWSAEGVGEAVENAIFTPPPLGFRGTLDGERIDSEGLEDWNRINVEAAKNQCFPMSIANSLQYLEERFGLDIPVDHKPGVGSDPDDDSLVGLLDELAGRESSGRRSGSGTWFTPMIQGKFIFLAEYGLGDELINRYQGRGWGDPPDQALPPGDYEHLGIPLEDQGEKVTWEWICEQIRMGEDVELCFSYPEGGGHAVRVFGCGKDNGRPYIDILHDADQNDDNAGLEWARIFVETDDEGFLTFGSPDLKIRFAMSESVKDERKTPTPEEPTATNTPTPRLPDEDTPTPIEEPTATDTPTPIIIEEPTPTLPPPPDDTPTPTTTPTPGRKSPTPTPQEPVEDCPVFFSIEEYETLPGGGTHSDILVHNPGGTAFVLPGGKLGDLMRAFLDDPNDDVMFELGLDGFDILELGEIAVGADRFHKVIFTLEHGIRISNTAHPAAGSTITDGDLLLTNGGMILNQALIPPLALIDENEEPVRELGIDAVEVETLLPSFDGLRNVVIGSLDELIEYMVTESLTIYISFEEVNEEYTATSGSLLPVGTRVSADDLIQYRITPNGPAARVVRSGVDQIPSTAPTLFDQFDAEENRGLDAAATCLDENEIYDELGRLHFSTELDDDLDPIEFREGDLLVHQFSSPTNYVHLTNGQLTGYPDNLYGLDGVDLYPKKVEPIETPTPTNTPEPTDTPRPSPTPTLTPTPSDTPEPTKPPVEECFVYFSIEEPNFLPNNAGDHGDILVENPGGPTYTLPGGSNYDLLRLFRELPITPDEVENRGLDGFDIIGLNKEVFEHDLRDPDLLMEMRLWHKIYFTTEEEVKITNPNHPLFGSSTGDGEIYLTNGGVILNQAIMQVMDLMREDEEPVEYLGIDALEIQGGVELFDQLEMTVVKSLMEFSDIDLPNEINLLFSFEENNEEYITGTGSVLPAGTRVSADDLILLTLELTGNITGQVVRSGANQIPSSAPSILEGFTVERNRGLDAIALCLEEWKWIEPVDQLYYSTESDDIDDTPPVEFQHGDVLFQNLAAGINQVYRKNIPLTGFDNPAGHWGLDALDVTKERIPITPTPTPTNTPIITPTPTDTLTPSPTFTPTIPQVEDCFVYFTIEEDLSLPTGGTHGDILLADPSGGPASVLPGGRNPELLRYFNDPDLDVRNYGLDGFDILTLDQEALNQDDRRPKHRIIFTIEEKMKVTHSKHILAGKTLTDGDVLLTNGGVILNQVLIDPLDLVEEDGNEVNFVGIDALEAEAFIRVFDALEMTVVSSVQLLNALSCITEKREFRLIFSLEEFNEEFVAGSNSLLPAGTRVSADDLILMRFTPSGASASVLRSGADQIPSSAPGILSGWPGRENRGLDAVSQCLSERILVDPHDTLFFSTELDDLRDPIDYREGDLLYHIASTMVNGLYLDNHQLTGDPDETYGLDGVDLFPERPGDIRPTPSPTEEPSPTSTPTSTPQLEPTPTFTSTPTPRLEPTPTPTRRIIITPFPTFLPERPVYVTDDVDSNEPLSGKTDYDRPGEEELVIHWEKISDEVASYHIWVQIDEEREFLASTGAKTNQFVWKRGAEGLNRMFSGGPEFGHHYRFFIFGLRESGPNRIMRNITHTAPVNFQPLIPKENVIVADDMGSYADLSGNIDLDEEGEEELVVRWNFDSEDVKTYHVWVRTGSNDSFEFLGLPRRPKEKHLRWAAEVPQIADAFADGPQSGEEYSFRVFLFTESGSPRVIGPIDTKAPVEFMTRSR